MNKESSGVPRPGPCPEGQPGEWVAPIDCHGIFFMGFQKNGLPGGADMLILRDPLISRPSFIYFYKSIIPIKRKH